MATGWPNSGKLFQEWLRFRQHIQLYHKKQKPSSFESCFVLPYLGNRTVDKLTWKHIAVVLPRRGWKREKALFLTFPGTQDRVDGGEASHTSSLVPHIHLPRNAHPFRCTHSLQEVRDLCIGTDSAVHSQIGTMTEQTFKRG